MGKQKIERISTKRFKVWECAEFLTEKNKDPYWRKNFKTAKYIKLLNGHCLMLKRLGRSLQEIADSYVPDNVNIGFIKRYGEAIKGRE